MAGPGATIRVDGFRGGRLPPKSQIQSIRFRRDLFAAENHGGGMVFVDIATRPGGGPLRGTADFMFRDESLNARNAFAPTPTPEQQQNGTFTLNGTLIKDRTGFSLTTQRDQRLRLEDARTRRCRSATSPAASAGRPIAPTSPARVDHALTKSRSLRASYQRTSTDSDNLGVGDFDLPERAYSRDTREDMFRLSVGGPVGRNFFNETRFQARHQTTCSTSATDAAGAARARRVQHRRRADRRRTKAAPTSSSPPTSTTPSAGTRPAPASCSRAAATAATTPATWAALSRSPASTTSTLGRPTTYTQRSGDPLVQYGHAQFGWYVQDDIRVARSLSLSFGLRHEVQTHIDDCDNFAPRVRRDVVAVQERLDDDSRRRRHLLRLVRSADLRADAARRRHAAGRYSSCRIPAFPIRSPAARHRPAVEPLSAGRRPAPADDRRAPTSASSARSAGSPASTSATASLAAAACSAATTSTRRSRTARRPDPDVRQRHPGGIDRRGRRPPDATPASTSRCRGTGRCCS